MPVVMLSRYTRVIAFLATTAAAVGVFRGVSGQMP